MKKKSQFLVLLCLPGFQVTTFYQAAVTFHVNSALAWGQMVGALLALAI